MARVMHYTKQRRCEECGNLFTIKSGTQRYCPGPHHTKCKICGKDIEYTCSPKEKPSYCSKECRNKGHERTVMKRYGVKNVSELQSVRDKISERNSSKEVDEKRRRHNLERWGVENVSQNNEIRKKLSAVMKTDRYLENRKKTCVEKYGFDSPMKHSDIKRKRANTCIERYGCEGHTNSKEFYEKRLIDGSKVDDFMSFRDDPESYIQSHYEDPPTIHRLESDLGCTNTPIYDILIKHDCRDMVMHTNSQIEEEVYRFLVNYVNEARIIRRDRNAIKPREIDLYIPDLQFGIECNPAATHNSTKNIFEDKPVPNNYHQMKSRLCEDRQIQLFHLFGYEWKHKRNIVESMIRYHLNSVDVKIGARNCRVDELSSEECRKFLDENHLQGSMNGSIRLGLRDKQSNELVSVMVFTRMRPTIGTLKCYEENMCELARFCSKLNTSVVGGANKLFKHFVNSYHPSKVVSFSDVAHTSGHLYKTLGFQKVNQSSPSYHWGDIYDDVWLNRVNCQKRFLQKLLNDESIDIENQTEKQIMESYGFVQIFDCGTIRWEWNDEKDL